MRLEFQSPDPKSVDLESLERAFRERAGSIPSLRQCPTLRVTALLRNTDLNRLHLCVELFDTLGRKTPIPKTKDGALQRSYIWSGTANPSDPKESLVSASFISNEIMNHVIATLS